MTLNDMMHKAIAYGFGALTVGAGTMIMSINRNDAVQDTKITEMQTALVKIDDITNTVHAIDTKVGVLDQKLNDTQESLKHK